MWSQSVSEFDPTLTELETESAVGAIAIPPAVVASAISAVVFDNRALRWRQTATGRFVSDASVTSELERHVSATFDALEGLTRRMYAQDITLTQWQASVASELKDAHLAQAMFARGGKANMGAAQFGRVGATLRDEYGFLAAFADDIAAGRVSEAQALARIRQYGRATRQSYWNEYRIASPGMVAWRLNPAEHCPDCLALAAGSPYRADQLPTVPGAGSTRCRGNCKCTLERL